MSSGSASVADRSRTAAQSLEQVPAGGVAQGAKDVIEPVRLVEHMLEFMPIRRLVK
ncbi:hypothetical protein [Nocardia sp. BMG51109]|uniref:hypothetical protein n=1 Tax=Nocardia sp. BMG51109 TaxID=1056816 RepID=UPI0004AD62E8|nr:hypothetical protein [Nocardia sp. BMG51109]